MLDAAVAVFAAQGFAHASMEAIAARAGTTKPTLYARFGAKDQLFAMAVRREHELLNSWITAQYETGNDEPFRQRLHRWVAVYFDFVRERPDGFRLTHEGERHAAAAAAIEQATSERVDRIAGLITRVSGHPDGAGPRVVAASLVGMLRWAASEAIRHPELDLQQVSDLLENMVYSMMRGLDVAAMDGISMAVTPGTVTAGRPRPS
jgi:AcrR family transcriptional regulator